VTLNKIGDVKLKEGDHEGALAAYEEGLAIRRELAKDLSNAEAQTDLAFSLYKIAHAGADAKDRLSEALTILKDLDAQGRLPPDKKAWIAPMAEEQAKLGAP
jgi:hypothetical protein